MRLVEPVMAGKVVALLILTVGMTGCTDVRRALSLDPGSVDPRSPIAIKAVEASRQHYRTIEFSSIPKVPSDLMTAPEVKSEVTGMMDVRRDLGRQTASLPPPQTDTEGFSQRTRDPLLAKDLVAPSPDQAARTDAYVQQLRDASVPPASDPNNVSADKPKSPGT